MTNEEALLEAQSRWGESAFADINPTFQHTIYRTGPNRRIFGASLESWEAAFEDAENRLHPPQPPEREGKQS